jgi:hypothetical protein
MMMMMMMMMMTTTTKTTTMMMTCLYSFGRTHSHSIKEYKKATKKLECQTMTEEKKQKKMQLKKCYVKNKINLGIICKASVIKCSYDRYTYGLSGGLHSYTL